MRGDASRVGGPIVRLVIAMALDRTGQLAEARNMLAAAILSSGWRATEAREQSEWICHVLRREAEGLILPNLPAFRRAEYQPRVNDERVALLAGQLASCEFEGRLGAAARLYSNVFAIEPSLDEDVALATRYHAARAAAVAGCGQGKDADQLHDEKRAFLRRQALNWLRQDLTWSGKQLDGGKAKTYDWIRPWLQFWLVDPDLAVVRDPAALAKLPDSEREQWRRLWTDVAALLAADPLEQGKTHPARRAGPRPPTATRGLSRAARRTTATSGSGTPPS
jgi:serine/threonine-protein kinase